MIWLRIAHPRLIDWRGPFAVLRRTERYFGVEVVEDSFLVEAKRIKQSRRRQFPAAIDAYMNDVLGIEFEIEPRTAIRDHPRGKEQLS